MGRDGGLIAKATKACGSRLSAGIVALHIEACRSLAAVVAFDHQVERGLDGSRVTSAVEKRRRQAIGGETLAEGGKQRRVRTEPHRERFIFVGVPGDELRQANRMEHARRDARCKGLAGEGNQREASPKRIPRRRMRVVGERIEKKIGELVAGKMVRRRHARREYEPVRLNGAFFRLGAQMDFRRRIARQKP